jgi:hypothetical protein
MFLFDTVGEKSVAYTCGYFVTGYEVTPCSAVCDVLDFLQLAAAISFYSFLFASACFVSNPNEHNEPHQCAIVRFSAIGNQNLNESSEYKETVVS